jgi:hypothetical protein
VGIADGPPHRQSAGTETGTRITFEAHDGSAAVDGDELLRQVDLWRDWNPGLTIDVD